MSSNDLPPSPPSTAATAQPHPEFTSADYYFDSYSHFGY